MKNLKFFFDKAANTYETHATIQKKVALELSNRIKSGKYCNVIEIGSGAGILTELLIEKIDFERFLHIDISLEFLRKIKNKFDKNHYHINAKAEEIPVREHIADLLISSSTLQWLKEPVFNILEIFKILRKGGNFYISIFTSNTLSEIKKVSQITGFGSVYDLKEIDFYLNTINTIGNIKKHEVKIYKQKYSSVKELLMSHKFTGTNYTEKKRFSGKEKFLKFCEIYKKLYGNSEGVYATYEVLFIEGQK